MKADNKKIVEKFINILLDVFIFVFGIVLLISLYTGVQTKIFKKNYADFFGYSTFEVQTGSMAPAINAGDWVIVKLTNDIKLDDIITYKQDKEFITHRVIQNYNNHYVTKGDANNAKDEPIAKKQILGKVVKVLSNFGIIRKTLFSPWGLISVIIILYIANLLFKKKDSKNIINNVIKNLISKIKSFISNKKEENKVIKQEKTFEEKKEEEQKITLEKVKEIYGTVPESELEQTSMYRVIPVNLSELDDTLLEIAKNEMKESEKKASKKEEIVKEEIIKENIPSDRTNSINLELLRSKMKNKKNKNPIDKAIFIKTEELNEIVDILHQDEKVLVNEATIKEIFITTYIEAKYYNCYGDKNIDYHGKNLGIKIERVTKELAKELIKDYHGSDLKYKDKVIKYVGIFILIANLEQSFISIEDIKARNEYYKKEITKFSKDLKWNNTKIKKVIEEIVKVQKNYVGILSFFLKKLDTNMFELHFNKLVTNKNMFCLELIHNIEFSKLYSDYIIDKTYTEGIIAEDKTIVLFNLLLIQVISDMFKCDFNKKYIAYIPSSLYSKEKKLEKILGLFEDEYAKSNIIILIKFEDLLKKKMLIKKIKKMGYRFALVFDKELEINANDQKYIVLADYIFINKKIANVPKMLSFVPEDVLNEVIYEDITNKIGDFGSE